MRVTCKHCQCKINLEDAGHHLREIHPTIAEPIAAEYSKKIADAHRLAMESGRRKKKAA